MMTWTPGTRVRAHKSTWVIQAVEETENGKRLRALALDGKQTRLLDPEDGVELLTAAAPSTEHLVPQSDAKLLRDALLLSTRRGAGPFRSLAGIGIQPHAYQIVPLMMALRQPTVRLLIADGTGIGKTVEAGLIVRELLDRGDIGRFTVLVPPHLVDQWVLELRDKFQLDAAAVTSNTINSLERKVPVGTPLFEHFRYTVVSLDYIKADKRFAEFKHMCPECVVVDEVHACVGGAASQQRYRLLKALAQKPDRHMVLCSATPHAGDAQGFGRLLGLLNPEFSDWEEKTAKQRDKLVPELRKCLVQRVRTDLVGWEDGDTRLFPQRETISAPYTLSDASKDFFDAIFKHCKERIEGTANEDERRRAFWSGMALLSCVSSSPGSALSALSLPPDKADDADNQPTTSNAVLEEEDGGFTQSDREPRQVLGAKVPENLIRQAQALAQKGAADDGKLKALLAAVGNCLAEGNNPIVFCRFVSTANYLGKHLKKAFNPVRCEVVTGDNGDAAQRKADVEKLEDAGQRILVATDCLSEGINLQNLFDAVIHYDLSWNPMRLQQREGRVDRLGQTSEQVKCITLHGPDNPIDAAMLEVLRRKATRIKDDLGTEIWLPEQGTEATQQLMGELLTHGGKALRGSKKTSSKKRSATMLDKEAETLRAIGEAQRHYAQKDLRPDEVIPEWRNALAALGGFEDLQSFVLGALNRVQATVEASPNKAHMFHVHLDSCLPYAQRRFDSQNFRRHGVLHFAPAGQSLPDTVNRGSPLVTALADLLEEQTRSKSPGDTAIGFLGRSGCWVARGIQERTVVLLIRLNHRLSVDGRVHDVSEASALAWTDDTIQAVKTHGEALALLSLPAAQNLAYPAQKRNVDAARTMRDARLPELDAFKQQRANALLADHLRMRKAVNSKGAIHVAPLHLEEMGLYVLLPEV